MVIAQQKTSLLYWSSVSSDMGECIVMATEAGVCWTGTPGATLEGALARTRRWLQFEQVVQGEEVVPLQQAVDELRRYFAGERVQFACPLDLRGTSFQLTVWRELCHIPYGEARSYGEIAGAIGRPSASRAVGAANGANPVAIIVPCHDSDGKFCWDKWTRKRGSSKVEKSERDDHSRRRMSMSMKPQGLEPIP
ncbi:MAG TPA: methylated-DNA--[protein]-cysteine S-methyltransferase, partial [Ktedonobacteraceae bacterium]